MIRINLLSDERQAGGPRLGAAASGFGRDEDRLGRNWLVTLVLVGVLAFAAYWFLLDRIGRGLDREIVAAQEVVTELAPAIEELDRLETRTAELEHRIRVIRALRENQPAPAQIMDQVSRALPDLLWLTRMEMQAHTVSLQGEARNTNAVAALMENLERVPSFQEPVLRTTQQRGEIYTFELTFNHVPAVGAGAEEGA